MKHKLSTILESVFNRMMEYPDRTCIVDNNGTRHNSNNEFLKTVSKMMGLFSERKLSSNDFVVIRFERGMEHIAAIYACVAYGCPYVTISPDYPQERVEKIIDNLNPMLILDPKIVTASDIKPTGTVMVNDVPDDSPCIGYYTSSSTGEPVGILHNRMIFVRDYCYWMKIKPTSDDNYLSITNYMFAFSIWDIFCPIVHGITLYIGSPELARDIVMLKKYIHDYKITCATMNPSVLRMVGPSSTLRNVIIGGERPGTFEGFENTTIINYYGCTECDGIAMSFITDYTRDPTLTTTCDGEEIILLGATKERPEGEIALRCDASMMRYIGRDDTCGKFTTDTATGKKILHTGDYGLMTDRGIAIIGRVDGMVKITGQRVEPSEVEIVINKIPGVKINVVKAFKDENSHYLCCYYVGTLSSKQIKDALSSKVTSYMIPSYFKKVDDLPRNTKGEIDRASLQSLKPKTVNGKPPENEEQARICKAFEKVFNINGIGIDSDFVQLGGDSLKAMKIQNIVGDISVADILMYHTPESICEKSEKTVIDVSYTLKDGCPLSNSQLNVYLDIMLKPEKLRSYLVYVSIDVDMDASIDEIRGAIMRVIDAHPILKARLVKRNEEPWIVFDATPTITIGEEPVCPTMEGCMSSFSISTKKVIASALHIAFDGTSVGIFKREFLKALHSEELVHEESFLSSSSFDRNIIGNKRYPIAEEFFERLFADADYSTDLLSDVSRSPKRKGHKIVRLPPTSNLSELVKRTGTSAGSIYISAFGYALSRFVGNQKVSFCFLENGRGSGSYDNSIGMFVRTIPICLDCSDLDVNGFIKNSSEIIYGAISNGIIPFAELKKKYDINANLLVQYAVDVDIDATGGLMDDDDVADLSFVIIDGRSETYAIVKHSDKYSNLFITSFSDVFTRIITQLPKCERLSDLDYTSVDDIRIQDEINETSYNLQYNDIIETFDDHVRSHPEHTLVSFRDKRYTYEQANRLTDGVAFWLSQKNIGKGDNVAILVPRSEWYLLAALSVLKAGSAYVPIDDSYPDDRIKFMIEDSASKIILSTEDTYSRACSIAGKEKVQIIEKIERHEFKRKAYDKHDNSMILYTSGSTGKPKGVIITRLAVINVAEWYARFTSMTDNDVYGMYTTFVFDMHTLALYPILTCGASLVVVPENARMNLKSLNDCFVDNHVTHTFITTHVGKMFADLNMKSDLRFLLFIGEKLGEYKAPEWIGACESYGPTESLALVSAIPVNDRNHESSVGPLNSNIKAYILDKEHRRVPIGAVGELYLSGFQLAKGYLNRDELNKDAFIHNIFDDDKGEEFQKMYATGDFFRYLPDRTIGILERRDGQVKIRGNRVELVEVESTIKLLDGVKDVTVDVITNSVGNKELCAYVVSEPDVSAEHIKECVASTKPQYMVPTYVVHMDKIPLNTNGKIDRRALPKPDRNISKTNYEQPKDEREKIICETFKEVFEIERIGRNDDYVELGGNSLKAILISSKLMQKGLSVSTVDVLLLRTPAKISSKAKDVFRIEYDYSTDWELTDAQRNVYEYCKNDVESNTNVSFLMKIKKQISRNKIVSMLNILIDVHPILRSRIILHEDVPYMRFDAKVDIAFEEKDPEQSASDFIEKIGVLDKSLAKLTVFDWGDWYYLMFDLSHLIYDAFSVIGLVKTINSLMYGAKEDLDIGILEKSAYDARGKEKESYQSCKKTVLSMTESAITNYLPEEKSQKPNYKLFDVTTKMTDIDKYLKNNNVGESLFFATALAKTFTKISGKNRCLFYITNNGRTNISNYQSVGLFAKSIPIALDVNDDDKIVLKKADEYLSAMIANDQYPLWTFCKERGLDWDIRYQYYPFPFYGEQEVEGISLIPIMTNEPVVNSNIWIRVNRDVGRFKIIIIRSTKYSDELMERIANEWNETIGEMVNNHKTGKKNG